MKLIELNIGDTVARTVDGHTTVYVIIEKEFMRDDLYNSIGELNSKLINL